MKKIKAIEKVEKAIEIAQHGMNMTDPEKIKDCFEAIVVACDLAHVMLKELETKINNLT